MTKIMLVEDDNNLREIYQARLAAEGYEIVSSSDGEAALAMAAKEHPDMIISDVMMPKISGFEMLDILRNTDSLKKVKIIMLTALGQAEDSARANALGADRYLVKSQVTLEDIVKATHDLLDAPAAGPAADTAPAVDIVSAPAAVIPKPTFPAAEPSAASLANEPISAPAIPVVTPPDYTAPAPPSSVVPVIPEPGQIQDDVKPTAPVDDPASEPAQSTPTSSIPVVEAPADTSTTTGAQVTDPPQTQTDLPIIPSPSASEEPATDESSTEEPSGNEDYTSPDSFNKFQIEPAEPSVNNSDLLLDTASSEANVGATDPQSTASEEASIKAQIDSFINTQPVAGSEPSQQPLATEPDVVPETAAGPTPVAVQVLTSEAPASTETAAANPATAPESAPEAAAEPTSVPLSSAQSTVVSVGEDNGIIEPEPEEISTYQAPVISSSAEAPAPTPVATPVAIKVTEAPQPEVPDQADSLLADAVENLSANAPVPELTKEAQTENADPALPATDNETGKKRIIQPLNTTIKPDIHQLLAVEDAKSAAFQASTAQPVAPPQPNVAAYSSPPQSGTKPPASSGVDPNSISL